MLGANNGGADRPKATSEARGCALKFLVWGMFEILHSNFSKLCILVLYFFYFLLPYILVGQSSPRPLPGGSTPLLVVLINFPV